METVREFVKANKPQGFEPRPYYSTEGDSLTFFFENRDYYRERIDDFLTVYRAMEGDGLVGCQIKGLPSTLKLLGDFGIIISDGKVALAMIFMACMAQTPEPASKECYRKLGKAAAETHATIPADMLEPILAG